MPARGTALALLLFLACVAPSGVGPPAPDPLALPRGAEALAPLVRWREAERRRDLAAAEAVLHLPDPAARRALERHLEALRAHPAGPVRSALEFVLVEGPTPWGDAVYLALEPDGARHALVRYELVAYPTGSRLAFDLPPWEAGELSRGARAAALLEAEVLRWREAPASALAREVRLLRWTLAGQVRARELAAQESVRLAAFAPDPAVLLAELEGLDDPGVRRVVLARLTRAAASR